MSPSAPVLAVLVADDDPRPEELRAIESRMSVRYCMAAELGDAVQGADAVLLWEFFSSALRDVWDRCDRLQWIHVAAAGVDKLLFPALRDSPVVVTNARGTFDRPIAEFVLASVSAHAKSLHESRELQRAHEWRHRETRSLHGARALVVGTGGIGRCIGRMLGSVGMTVSGAGRTARPGDADFADIRASNGLPSYVGDFDYVINVTPLTPDTRGMFDRTVFRAMRSSAYFVNVGRGASVVEADLIAALRSGELAGAALDVFEDEPLDPTSPLWDLPGVSVSPHMSGDVVGWRDALAEQFLDLADRWLQGQPLPHAVDKRLGFVATTS